MSCPVRIMRENKHESGSNIKQKYLFSFSLALHDAVGVLWATNPNDGKGRMMDTKERLKHASEVLGWLAEGKELEYKFPAGKDVWHTLETPNARGVAGMILDGTYLYRIKPEPVEFEGVIGLLLGEYVIRVNQSGLKLGMRVKVTLLES